MTNRIIFHLLLVFLFLSCSNLENVEVKEGNVVTESYTRRKSDFAKHGTYNRFSPEGKLIEQAEYHDNKLHGKQAFFYPNGEVQEFVHYENGTHHGDYKTFFDDGQVELEGEYVNGTMEGELKAYYPSGQLKEVVIFEKGEERGPFKEYYKNGNLKTEGTYNGADPDTDVALEHGELKKYDEHGEHFQTMECTNGRCQTTWLREGTDVNAE
ncbi:MAG: toxin-antitoxin system YwqK family antitoxin [Bacteroidota bacterium]